MVAFYQHNISAWMDGTESLPDGEYRAYHVIIQLIYLQNGPIVYNEAGIAGRCNQHVLKFRTNFKKLCDAGKLSIVDGKITNQKASSVLGEIARKRRAMSGQPPTDLKPTSPTPPLGEPEVAGRSRGGLRNKSLKNKKSPEVGFPLEPRITEPRITKSNTDTGNPNTQLAVVDGHPDPDAWPSDAFERCWKAYPNKIAKSVAAKSFAKVQRNPPFGYLEFCKALRRYINKTDDRPWCHFSTWLNQGRWTDEMSSAPPKQQTTSRNGIAALVVEEIHDRMKEAQNV